MKDKPTCGSCPYYDLEGACRRHAPIWLYRGNRPFNDIDNEPRMDHHYWCGDHPDFGAYIRDQRVQSDEFQKRKVPATPGQLIDALNDEDVRVDTNKRRVAKKSIREKGD